LKILDYPWHQAHLYRLAQALPVTFGVAAIRQPVWNYAQRPMPRNVRVVDWPGLVNVQRSEYDGALLHLDNWCDRLNLRALPFRQMRALTQDLPQVIIMHGTPDDERNRQAILRLIGDLPVVCNSHQAAQEWDAGEQHADRHGLPQFRAIIHGYTDEWYNYPLDERPDGAITICSGGEMSREYHGLPLVERLQRDVNLIWYGPNGDRPWAQDYHGYRHFLASARVYFSPTRRGPMPGSRTEAMLSGCCIVTVPGNDIEDIITDGATGLVVSDYRQARDMLRDLEHNPIDAYEIGQRGRALALREFDPVRYAEDWLRVWAEVGATG
jgi:glycosyltransferase involved in cell wall biosynthesis